SARRQLQSLIRLRADRVAWPRAGSHERGRGRAHELHFLPFAVGQRERRRNQGCYGEEDRQSAAHAVGPASRVPALVEQAFAKDAQKSLPWPARGPPSVAAQRFRKDLFDERTNGRSSFESRRR